MLSVANKPIKLNVVMPSVVAPTFYDAFTLAKFRRKKRRDGVPRLLGHRVDK